MSPNAPGATHSQEGEMPNPIDTSLFCTEQRTTHFVKDVTIDAPIQEVYAAWTDAESWRRAYAPEREVMRANIDLEIGGRYEWLWDGETGSNGCQVLSFIPNRMVCFSWNAPPDQPESRARRTFVVVELSRSPSGGTHCVLPHQGFGEAEHWRETHAYFEKAWEHVLGKMKENLVAARR